MTDNILWVEAYRPQKVSDCILPDHLKELETTEIGGIIPTMFSIDQ